MKLNYSEGSKLNFTVFNPCSAKFPTTETCESCNGQGGRFQGYSNEPWEWRDCIICKGEGVLFHPTSRAKRRYRIRKIMHRVAA